MPPPPVLVEGDLGETDGFLEDLEGQEEDFGAELSTAGAPWAEAALQVAQRLLQDASFAGIELFSFRAVLANMRCDIRLDKLEGAS